ncbi:OprO/OprP family phosphate-selective porin [Qipengyuania qiaonensis]|uniref:Porin n=1 Tax=Qipengyuania qiaonensis TaxID=2867240 RepID=A0ABS7J6Y7_9SPHN|nr:porin [Qipengyuania qiaonensis]MBX7481408.1 hypothetical protein [Qipengyuania qiaonensis]
MAPALRIPAAAAFCCFSIHPLFAQEADLSAEDLSASRTQPLAATDADGTDTAKTDAATGVEIAESEPARDDLIQEDSWSFEPRGRLMFDAGFTDVPDAAGASEGFGNELRRARLGASGNIPGGFGYKFEFDFAGDEVQATDAYLTYSDGPLEIIVGQHNNFQSLEELTSSLDTTFIERAAFTDAFGFERRLGASASYSKGNFLLQAGIFTDDLEDMSSKNRSADARVVFMPKSGPAQLHFGASFHYTHLDDPASSLRYRQRPLVHFTAERFVDTGDLGADSESGFGLEAAAIAGRFHVAAEGFWQSVDIASSSSDPAFFGGYLEAGLFLTDDTRGYGGGKFERTKPSRPVGDGGPGSLQFNIRYDHLDLNDSGILGGVQAGYLASLIWKPTGHTALIVNYGRLQYTDAVIATATGDTFYGVDALGLRAQIDF